MTRRSTVRLPVAVFVTIGAAVVAIMTGQAEAAVLAAPWMVLLVLGLSGARRQQVSASIAVVADRVVVGDNIQVVTRVKADSGWVEATCRPHKRFRSDWSPVGAGTKAVSASIADVIDPRGRVELRSSLPATVWGTHDVGRVEVQVHEPYGLLRWDGVVREPTPVRVHPDALQLQRLLRPWFVRRLSGAHGSTAVDRGVEYADIRPFVSGDSLREINWRVSARSDGLWVSRRHPERATDVVLLLDSFVESGHDVRSVVGLAIEAAVALAESHLSVTDRVGLIEMGGVVRWVSPGTGRLQLQRLTDALLATGLYANASERDLTVIPHRALPPRSFVLALSPLFDDRFLDALFALRGAGHDVAVVDCSPIDDSGERDNDDPNGDRVSEASQLARRIWQAERGITRDQLAEHGVAVGRWRRGVHLDLVLADLTRRRRRARWAASR